jgi:hypothetical protein
MTKTWKRFVFAQSFVLTLIFAVNSFASIALVGKGAVSGSAIDKSGLEGNTCSASDSTLCVPKAILGGWGSDIAYTGHDNVFIAAPDRGPFDGLTDNAYLDRFHFFYMVTEVGAAFPNIHPVLLDTRFFRNEFGQTFVGAAGAFDNRLDPEGIAVAPDGTFYISDEYGPYIFQFDRQGNIIRRLSVPDKFAIANPSEVANNELLLNTAGRQANRGMEGLAISPDGTTLFGIMQNALIQDHGLSGLDRLGLNNRILKIDLRTGVTEEFVYVVDAINRGQGVNDLLAINDHEFLAIERDNRSNLQTPPQAPTRKTIYKIDVTNATDVSDVASLPAGALPANIKPVSKSLFINLLDPSYNLAPTIAEKIEGLAWGPDLEDGRHLLYVVSDNDLTPSIATQIYSFAIGADDIALDPQNLPGPLFPPGQVKKLLK